MVYKWRDATLQGVEQQWVAKPNAQESMKEPQVGDRIVREGTQLDLRVGMAGGGQHVHRMDGN